MRRAGSPCVRIERKRDDGSGRFAEDVGRVTCALDQGPVMRSLDVIGGFARLVRENGQGRHIFTKMSLALLALPSGTCGA